MPTDWGLRAAEKPRKAREPPDRTQVAVRAAIAALEPSERRKIERHLEHGGTAYVQLILT